MLGARIDRRPSGMALRAGRGKGGAGEGGRERETTGEFCVSMTSQDEPSTIVSCCMIMWK